MKSLCPVAALLPQLQQNLKHFCCKEIADHPLVRRAAEDFLGGNKAAVDGLGNYEIVAAQCCEAAAKMLQNLALPGFLHVGAGFSWMPLAMATTRSTKVAIEIDYRSIVEQKDIVARDVLQTRRTQSMNTLRRLPINSVEDLRNGQYRANLVALLDCPTATLTEFLLDWCPDEKKKQIAQFMHAILSATGGVWVDVSVITYDYLQKLLADDPGLVAVFKAISANVGFDATTTFFKDDRTQKAFFEENGFRVKEHVAADIAPGIAHAAPAAAARAGTTIFGKVADIERENYRIVVATPV